MFDRLEQAVEYAREMSRTTSGYVGIIMTKNEKFNVAADWTEVEYAENFGWTVAPTVLK